MSSHDHDRLPDEGSAPRTRAGTSLAPAGGTRSRRRPAASAGEKASKAAPAPRQGDAQKPRSTRPGSTSTATKATAAKPAPAPRKAKAPTAEPAATGTTAAEKSTAPTAEAAPRPRPRPTPRPRPAAEASAEPTPEPTPEVAVEPADVIEPADLVEEPATGEEDGDGTPARHLARRPWRGRLLRRRPALCAAATLVGALGVVAVYAGPAAQADPAEEPSHSMSVAAELGISSETLAAPDAHDTDRLAELAASRATREAQQTQAIAAQAEADRLAAEAIAEANRPKAVLPVNGARLTSGFGFRWGTLHAGIDLAAPMLTPEYAAMDGVVLEAGPASGYGNAVYIQHENGDVTVYGHMEEILVQPGQVVKAGDTIALLGNRGQSTGPHLHFEVHVGGLDGEKVDPIPWLRERGVQI
ncbi:peptidoglycan DD-metalloendopeptidase family protein [Blastococcus sp. SYSU D00669]